MQLTQSGDDSLDHILYAILVNTKATEENLDNYKLKRTAVKILELG
jgi:hypothetical protein